MCPAITGVGVNPKDLDEVEGEEEEEEEKDSFGVRELFWDRLVLFLTGAIVALTAVDILTELLRGGTDIVCYIPEDWNVSASQDAFIHSFCAQSVPDSQYLPIFLLVHGVLLGVSHYMWRSSFSSHLGVFFSLVRKLTRLKDETVGVYPFQNMIIIRKLMVEFSAYNRRRVFTWYQFKLFIQIVIAAVSLLLSFLVFNDFDVEFECPWNNKKKSVWPFPGMAVDCIYTSLRFFSLVHFVDAILLILVMIILVCGFMWTTWRHPRELNAKNIALFSFTSGIDGSFFVPKPMFGGLICFFRGICSKNILHEVNHRFLVPRIRTDLDFLLMLLYRTDSGLAHAFSEGQAYMEHKALLVLDHQLIRNYDAFDEDKDKDKKVDRQLSKIDTGWKIKAETKLTFTTVDPKKSLYIPNNIRGAVMGLSLRSPANVCAVDVSFGSMGFSNALIRIFKRVGSLNFDPAYKDETGTTKQSEDTTKQSKDETGTTKQTNYTTGVIGYRCHDDIFTKGRESFKEFNMKTNDIWEEGDKKFAFNIDFMVIGPIVELKHVGTAKHLLKQWYKSFAKEALLVIIQPVKIEGSKGSFYHFVPPEKYFKKFDPQVNTTDQQLSWPEDPSPSVQLEDPSPSVPPVRGEIFHLMCGNTSCDFRVQCYKFNNEDGSKEAKQKGTSSPSGVTQTSEDAGKPKKRPNVEANVVVQLEEDGEMRKQGSKGKESAQDDKEILLAVIKK